MKRQSLWLLLAMAAIGCGKSSEEVQPEMKFLTSAIYASGTLVPEQEYKVISGVDGYLVNAYVKEGDTVTKNQKLFYVSNDVREAQQQGAALLVQRTLPTVSSGAPIFKELEGRMEVARIKKQQDSLQYARYEKLFRENAISQSSYERYFLQYESSRKDYENLKEQLRQQKLAGDIQLQQAETQLSVARAQSDVGMLKSFVNGIVYDVYKKEGDLINPNQPVALVGTGDMIAKLSVDESDLNKMYLGQKVLLTMDAFPDKVFKAHVSKLYPLLNKVEQSFRVDAVLDDAIPVEMYGLNLEANIVVAEHREVLAIPKTALLKGDSVLVKKDGKETAVKIEKGIEDDKWVEVKGGLTKSSTIIVR